MDCVRYECVIKSNEQLTDEVCVWNYSLVSVQSTGNETVMVR
jgi:hypothetical protein